MKGTHEKGTEKRKKIDSTGVNQEDTEETGATAENTQEGVVRIDTIEQVETYTTTVGVLAGHEEQRKNTIEDIKNTKETTQIV